MPNTWQWSVVPATHTVDLGRYHPQCVPKEENTLKNFELTKKQQRMTFRHSYHLRCTLDVTQGWEPRSAARDSANIKVYHLAIKIFPLSRQRVAGRARLRESCRRHSLLSSPRSLTWNRRP